MPSPLIVIYWQGRTTASEDTWGYHLLEASEQGLNPDYSIADAGKGLRAGHKAAWPEKPCHGDVFHILHQGEGLENYLQRRANGATWNQLHHQIGSQFYLLTEAVEQAMKETPRASSLVENFNSRLRNYFFLRRTLGNDYLDLLRFFLNHRTFMRSEHPEREGKSPTELLTGESHSHWLELLGFDLFRKPAIVA